MKLTNNEHFTLICALSHWKERCKKEAETMRQLAIELPDMKDKALANAAASDQFYADTEALLVKLRSA